MAARRALFQGAREAAGVPAGTLAAGYIGFGALAAGYGLPLFAVTLSTPILWAMPAQLILVEMYSAGAAWVALLLSVILSSSRFLPMTASLMPMVRHERHPAWAYYATAQILSITGWTMAMVRFPRIAAEHRLAWLVGFAGVCVLASTVATVVGYAIADALTPLAKLGLVFLAPMYYLLIVLSGMRDRTATLAVAGGAIAGPLAWMASPDWSVLAGGLAGGTFAWAIDRSLRRRG